MRGSVAQPAKERRISNLNKKPLWIIFFFNILFPQPPYSQTVLANHEASQPHLLRFPCISTFLWPTAVTKHLYFPLYNKCHVWPFLLRVIIFPSFLLGKADLIFFWLDLLSYKCDIPTTYTIFLQLNTQRTCNIFSTFIKFGDTFTHNASWSKY